MQAAREAARRSSCANNLSQLIIAVHNYEMAHGYYPHGTLDAKGPIVNAQIGYHHNWIIQILPFLEERNTWNAIDKTLSVYHPKNAPASGVTIRTLDCPSSAAGNNASSHYAGVHHDSEKPIDAKDNGVFFLNSKVRYDDVTDGSSHTIFIGEKIPDAWDLFWMSGTRATLRNVGTGVNSLTFATGLPRPGGPTDPVPPPPPDAVPAIDDVEKPADPAVPADVGAAAPKGAVAAPGSPLWVGGFGSQHPGGAMFAMGDGSIRFLSNTTGAPVLAELAHRSDGKLPQGN
ncbi:MAG: DUF1559 domain-containing protein [Planctomycetaceae bacterium]|nr:DUF1559 domain-containing protein [Planctomycetaceae bacterium]